MGTDEMLARDLELSGHRGLPLKIVIVIIAAHEIRHIDVVPPARPACLETSA